MNEPQASLAELFRQARAGDERALGRAIVRWIVDLAQ